MLRTQNSIGNRATRRLIRLACLALAPMLVYPTLVDRARAADEPASSERADETVFLRLTRNEDDLPQTMETAVVRYVPADGSSDVYVDLVSAVHIGEGSYYEQLNKAFEDYDVVLYELVAPEGTRVPAGGGSSGHPVSLLQRGLKNMLDLESQVERIDYQKDNFVHADMSPEEFAESMRDRGESFWTMFFRMLGESMIRQSQKPNQSTSDLDMLRALFDPSRAVSLKRMMAEQFEDLDGMMNAFQGPDGSTIISERNKKALSVLREQLDAGSKRIAIFYGAGHMTDMAERLESDFGFKQDNVRWLIAWDLRDEDERAKAADEVESKSTNDSPPAKKRRRIIQIRRAVPQP